MSLDERLSNRSCKLIREGKYLYLKDKKSKFYLHGWTNIAAGPDKVVWGQRCAAMEIFNLKWAFALAPLYKCVVVAYDPKTESEQVLTKKSCSQKSC